MRVVAGMALAASLILPASSTAQAVGGSSGGLSTLATVSVDTSSPTGVTIPATFVGLSVEVGDFVNGYFQGTNWGATGNAASFTGLLTLLGPNGTLRIGGASSDVPTAPNITAQMATNLNTWLASMGTWQVYYGLDLVANDTAAATTTASRLTSALGVSNVVFQIGNEPAFDTGDTPAQYETAWNNYYSAIVAAVPTAKFAAIDDGLNLAWGNAITVSNALTPTLSGLQALTQHWYAWNNGSTAPGYATPQNLIAAILLNANGTRQNGGGTPYATNWGLGYLGYGGSTGSVPQIMTETSSISSHGQPGLSDRLVGMTSELNMEIILANAGWQRIHLHDVYVGGQASYNPFVQQGDGGFSPGPTFYAMYLFSKVQGQQILSATTVGKNIAVIATLRAAGKANILVVNNDANVQKMITPSQSAAWTTATVLEIYAPSCTSASLTIGGQPIQEGGVWTGAPFTISNGQSIQLPPCGAALISVQ